SRAPPSAGPRRNCARTPAPPRWSPESWHTGWWAAPSRRAGHRPRSARLPAGSPRRRCRARTATGRPAGPRLLRAPAPPSGSGSGVVRHWRHCADCERGESACRTGCSTLLVEVAAAGLRARAPALPGLLHGTLLQLGLQIVQLGELCGGDEHLTAHLHQIRMPTAAEPFGDVGHVHRILGDVLTHPPVPTGRRADEAALLVTQCDGQAVDLQLAQPTHGA